MKRILSITVCLLLLCTVLCACGKKAAPAEDGQLTAVYNDAGALTGYERRYHNDSGLITRLDRYDADQNYLSYVLYAYDDADRLFTETYFSSQGFGQERIVYTYDDNGRLTEKAFEQSRGEVTVEVYAADGTVIEKRYYDTDERLSYTEKLEDGAWVRYDPTEPPATDDEA